jgi:hypothetical protein
MSVITSVRNQQANIIAQNPAPIVITRKAKTLSSGAWSVSESTLDSQDIRIYYKKTRVLSVSDGGWHSIRVTKAIALYDADINAYSANNEDKFTHDGKTWRVFDVENVKVAGETVFKQLELEQL